MKKILLFCLLLLAPALFSQTPQRYDSVVNSRSGPYITFQPNASVKVCGFPAVYVRGSFCTNLATTYTDATLNVQCPANAQITPAMGGSCRTASDSSDGSFGFWVSPGQYTFMYQVGNTVYGPYYVNNISVGGVPNTTRVNTTAPITGGGVLTGSLTLGCAVASGSQAGCVSAADWNNFNSKQPPLGYVPLRPTNNLSDVANVTSARTNLGLGTAATHADTDFALSATAVITTAPLVGGGNLSSSLNLTCNTASGSQGGCLSAADWSNFNSKQTALGFTPLNQASNLSDVASATSARTNLGLGTAATHPSTDFALATDTVNGHALSGNVVVSASDLTTGSLPHAQLPTLLSGDIPNNAANTSGNANTASALASTPTQCLSGNVATGVAVSGNANCSAVVNSFNTRTGVLTLSSADVTTALGYAPASLSAANTWTQPQTVPNLLLALINGSPSAPTSVSSVVVHEGDSITKGLVAAQWKGYVYLVDNALGAAPANRGITGEQAADMGDEEIFPNDNPTSFGSAIYTVMIGMNDAIVKHAGPYEAVFQLCHQAALSWLAIGSGYKVFAQASTVTTTGTWVTDNTYQTGIGMKSTTNGSTMSIPFTAYGNGTYLWYRVMDGNGGVFTYAVDGGSPVSVNNFTSPAIAANNGGTQGVGVARITGLTAGAHTVLVTVTSATNAGNIVGILGVGSAPGLLPSQLYYQGPRVFSGGVTYEQADGGSADTAAYNADALADAALLYGDGLPVYAVNVRNYLTLAMANTGSTYISGVHPTTAGHAQVAAGFLAVMQPVGSSPRQMSGTFQTDTASIGSELTSSSGWTSTGWTGSYGGGFTNTASNTAALCYSPSISAGFVYQIKFTIAGMTTGTVTPSMGGVTLPTYSSNQSVIYSPKASAGTALCFTPTSTFDGTISNISVTLESFSFPSISATDSLGTNTFQARFSLASLSSLFFGLNSGQYNLTGTNNTGFGVNALENVSSGSGNTALGNVAGASLTAGVSNTFVGSQAGQALTTGSSNTLNGQASGESLTTGSSNTFTGTNAGLHTTTASSNTFTGTNAGAANTTGTFNAAGGTSALTSATTASDNTASGALALQSITTGGNNTAVGFAAGKSTSTAGNNQTSSHTVMLGDSTSVGADGDTDEIVIGSAAVGGGSHTTTIGTSTTTHTNIPHGDLQLGGSAAGITINSTSCPLGGSCSVAVSGSGTVTASSVSVSNSQVTCFNNSTTDIANCPAQPPHIICDQRTFVTHAGDTVATVLGYCDIPKGTLGATSRINVKMWGAACTATNTPYNPCTTNTGTCTPAVYWNTQNIAGGTTTMNNSIAAAKNWNYDSWVTNLNATNSQQVDFLGTSTAGNNFNAPTTAALDTSGGSATDTFVVFRITNANNSDTCGMKWQVILWP